MPKRTGNKKRPNQGLDFVQNARRVVLESVSEAESVTVSTNLVSQVMAAMGRKGGLTGGRNRMAMLTSDERSRLGKMAAEKRWGKRRKLKK